MDDYSKITKFIPAFTCGDLGAWIYENGELRLEYAEVVYRFCDAVEAFCEQHEPNETMKNILRAIRTEDTAPGTLLGYIANGTILNWLMELDAA